MYPCGVAWPPRVLYKLVWEALWQQERQIDVDQQCDHQQILHSLLCFGTVCQNASIFLVYARFYKDAAKHQHTLGTVCKSNEISCHFWREYRVMLARSLHCITRDLKKNGHIVRSLNDMELYLVAISGHYKSLWVWQPWLSNIRGGTKTQMQCGKPGAGC